jgi:hypothetical protein
MKRVIFCAFLCILLIGTVSAVNLTPSKIPAATLKITAAPTLQYIVKPDIHVSFSPSATPTLDINEAIITFESTPPGANVYAWGWMVNELTPCSQKVGIAPVIIPITISYAGYQDYHQNLSVIGRQTYTVSAVLIPITPAPTSQPVVSETPATQSDNIPTNAPATTQQVQVQPTSSGSAGSDSTGSLSVTTTPAGAVVSVDNEVKGISPAMISGITPGTHTLKITKAGYQDFSTTIIIEAGKVREYSTGLTEAIPGATTTTATSAATTPANSLGFPVFAAIIAIIGLVIVRKISR